MLEVCVESWVCRQLAAVGVSNLPFKVFLEDLSKGHCPEDLSGRSRFQARNLVSICFAGGPITDFFLACTAFGSGWNCFVHAGFLAGAKVLKGYDPTQKPPVEAGVMV